MRVEVETVDPVKRRLVVEVPAEDVRAEMERAYGELSRHARVRGFRPGRTPRPVLEQFYGEQVRADVFAKLIQQSYQGALQEQGLAVVSEPQIVTERAEEGAPLRYSATVEVKPDIAVQRYTGFDVERPLPPVTEANVDSVLERLRERAAQLQPISDRFDVRRGDVVTLDYEARIDARVIGRAQDRLMEMGQAVVSADFDAAIEGAAVGTSREFDVRYPADHHKRELAGQAVHFAVSIKTLAAKHLPALDDDFAKDHGDETLPAFRARLRQQLEEQATRRADDAVRSAVVEHLVKEHELMAPEAMVHRRAHAMAEEMLQSVRDPRVPRRSADEHEQIERLAAQLEPQACVQVKAALLLDAIAQREQLAVTEAELEMHVSELAEQSGNMAERVRAIYQDAEPRASLRGRLLQQRALDLVVARANVTTVAHDPSVADPAQNG